MAKKSKIRWTNHRMNLWQDCNKVLAEYPKCYIAGIMRRAGREPFKGLMRTVDSSLRRNILPDKQNRTDGEPHG